MPLLRDADINILTNSWRTIEPRFGRPASWPVELDLGCGKGGLSLTLAERYPERVVLACDVMLGRLRRVANKARSRGLANVILLRANSLDLVAYQLPPACANRVHLICPDPWPKARHRARRLVNTDFLRRVARVLVPGGVLHVATDASDYRDAMLAALTDLPDFYPVPDRHVIADIADIKTEFEQRWNRQGTRVPHDAFIRVAGGVT